MSTTVHVDINGTNRDSLVSRPGGFSVTLRQNQRPTGHITLRSKDGLYRPETGQSIVIWENSDRLFSGSLDGITENRATTGGPSPEVNYECDLVGLAARLDVRVCDVAVTYKSVSAQTIVLAVMAAHAPDEGIAYAAAGSGGYVEDGATVQKYIVDHQTVAQVISDMAALSGKVWFVSPDDDLHMQDRDTTTAPFTWTDTDGRLTRLSVNRTRADYANEEWRKLPWTAFEPTVETFVGDGSTRTWDLADPATIVERVTLDDVDVEFGAEDEGRKYTYFPGETTIEQDSGETVLTSGNTLKIWYRVLGGNYIFAQDSGEITARATVEGNSGHYARVSQDDSAANAAVANDVLNADLAQAAAIPMVLTAETNSELCSPRPGMLVTVDRSVPLASGDFLIQDVTASYSAPYREIRYSCTLVDGTRVQNEIDFFAGLASGGGSGSGSAAQSGGGGGVFPKDAIATLTSDATLVVGAQIVAMDTTAGDVTATLPSATGMIGQRMTLWKPVAANSAMVDGAGSETIDGALSYTMTDQWASVTIEAISATAWKIVSAAVATTTSGPTAPGDFTIGGLTFDWRTGPSGIPGKPGVTLRIFVPVTPPTPIGTTKGGHLYLELPDQSASPNTPMDGSVQLNGSAALQGQWSPRDLGRYAYDAAEQPWYFDLDERILENTTLRLSVAPYSDDIDTPLVQYGQPGATPSATLTVTPYVSPKANSGSNITDLLVTGVSASAAATQIVSGRLVRPISVTVDLTGLPAVLPDNWAYQIRAYAGGIVDDAHLLAASGAFSSSGLVEAGPDGITDPHTFAIDEPSTLTSAVIYAVAGLVLHPKGSSGGVFSRNNIVPGITVSATVSIGTLTGVIDPTQHIAALLDTSVGVNNLVFGVLPQGVDNARIALLAVNTPQLAALAATAVKIANSAVGPAQIASLAVGTAAIQTAAITTALVANAAITNALIGNLAVGTAQIANLAVGTAQLANLAVTNAKINDLDVSKLNAGTVGVSSPGAMVAVKYNTNSLQTQIFPGSINGYSDSGALWFQIGGGSGSSIAQLAVSDVAGLHVCVLQPGIGLVLSSATPLIIGGNQVVGTRKSAVSSPSGGSVIDVQSRTAIDAIRAVLSAALGGHGLTA